MNNNNNIYQDNYDKKPNIIHNSNSNSYYYLDIINNKYKNSKSSRPNNHSTININYDDKFNLNEHYSPIKHKYKINKNKNYCYYQKIQTTIDQQINNNKHNNHKRLVINNSENFQKNNLIKYNEKNIKKINNIRNFSYKRSYDGKPIRERKKKEILGNRDLTEPELMMMLNPIKCKESAKNYVKKKNLNISVIDNLGQNNFLKHIKQIKPENINSLRLNQYYVNNSINSITNNKNIERNRGPQIFNNFYSINNIANSKIPVRVINVYN